MPPRWAPSVVQVCPANGGGMAATDWNNMLLVAKIFRAKKHNNAYRGLFLRPPVSEVEKAEKAQPEINDDNDNS
eukprot:997072-Pyramimonas_sp.AAC.1